MTNNSNSIVSSNALIGSAFKAADQSIKQGNNSVQQMAAGIMLYHAEHQTSERASFDAMSARGEAFKLLKAEIVTEFVVARITDKSKNAAGQTYTIDQVTKINRQNATQMVALNKGFDLAIALHSSGVTSHSFDAKAGLFVVPVATLLPTGEDGERAEPVGQLSKMDKAGINVALDGTAYRYELGGKLVSFTAFPAHVLAVAGYKKSKPAATTATSATTHSNGASDTSTTGGGAAVDVRANVTTWSVEAASSMIARLALHIDTIMREEPPMAYSAWPVELVNAVTELCLLRDDAQAVDARAKVQAA